jgi:hypothetical protein
MNKQIIFSDGRKGGIGKSTTCICIIDYLLKQQGKNILLVDADHTNPEVARLFQNNKQIACLTYDLHLDSEWMELGHSIEKHSKHIDYVVVNLPAAMDIGPFLEHYGDSIRELGFEISVFFTITKQADSINLLGHSLHTGSLKFANHRVVVKNGFFGLEDEFIRFDESDTKKTLLKMDGKIIYFRELFFKSYDLCLDQHQKTFSQAVEDEMMLFTRHQIKRWIDDIHAAISSVISEPLVEESDVS